MFPTPVALDAARSTGDSRCATKTWTTRARYTLSVHNTSPRTMRSGATRTTTPRTGRCSSFSRAATSTWRRCANPTSIARGRAGAPTIPLQRVNPNWTAPGRGGARSCPVLATPTRTARLPARPVSSASPTCADGPLPARRRFRSMVFARPRRGRLGASRRRYARGAITTPPLSKRMFRFRARDCCC